MLSKEIEQGQRKCHRYWPDSGASPPQPRLRYGDITVAHVGTDPADCYTARSFTMRRGGETRNVEQFMFTAWPDHGVPLSTSEILLLRESVRAAVATSSSKGPMIVHCSAGVGRSGAYIAIDRALEEAESGSVNIDVRAIVADLRNCRNLMVASKRG